MKEYSKGLQGETKRANGAKKTRMQSTSIYVRESSRTSQQGGLTESGPALHQGGLREGGSLHLEA